MGYKSRSLRDVREEAARSLGQIGDAEAVPVLIKTLQKDKSHRVREAAARSLGQIGDSEAVPVLIAIMQKRSRRSLRLRVQVAEALGKFGNTEAVHALTCALHNPDECPERQVSEHEVRRMASEALADISSSTRIGSVEAMMALVAAVQGDPNPKLRGYGGANSVRILAIQALGKIGSLEAVVALIAATKFENTSDDFDIQPLRSAALFALEDTGNADAVPALATILLEHKDASMRRYAASALGKIGSNAALLALIRALEQEREQRVYWAAKDALDRMRLLHASTLQDPGSR